MERQERERGRERKRETDRQTGRQAGGPRHKQRKVETRAETRVNYRGHREKETRWSYLPVIGPTPQIDFKLIAFDLRRGRDFCLGDGSVAKPATTC